jgi:oligoendopeptidase F
MYATITRQAYFTMFEIEAHKAIADHHATIDKVAEIYLNYLSEQFGDSIDVTRFSVGMALYSSFVSYTILLLCVLVWKLVGHVTISTIQGWRKSFIPRYFKILEAGGSRKPEKLLKDSGIDISNEGFWQQGFELVENKIKEFNNLCIVILVT